MDHLKLLNLTGYFEHFQVKIWWLKLAWPDPENSTVLLAKILEDVCSCATNYSDLLRDKVDSMFWQTENSDQLFITERVSLILYFSNLRLM